MAVLLPWRKPGLICQGTPIGMVSRDASLRVWGALCHGKAVKGAWTVAQRKRHISHLELLAAFLALEHFQLVLMGTVQTVSFLSPIF
ncbi:uncharacterized protein AKAME5_001750600 [Lates japonicus]|uniref:Uncharacterized protein n=1 Tax=Lates japonicus TaxID=270547 RepID=A0AAD3N5U1_LATJO|nr:uncharacterized protein AKAME5_001750600 [Lates japonicus]